jgi:diaminopimelate epimerase
VDGRVVSLDLPAPRQLPQYPALDAPGTGKPSMIDVGVPHLVVEVAGLADLDLPLLAPPLRAHPALAPDGANVNFFESDPDGPVKVRSWERGVEGETLCCGSGLVAVALQVMAERRSRRIELVPASGDRLTVEALGEPPGCPTRFTGPARMVARIDPTEDFLKPGTQL